MFGNKLNLSNIGSSKPGNNEKNEPEPAAKVPSLG